MDLCFPNLDALRLALTSGSIPPVVSVTSVRAGFAGDGCVWVGTDAALPRGALASLRRLGAQAAKTPSAEITDELSCWPQILPLQRDPDWQVPSSKTPVLFELPDAALLSTVVSEILRLGNDRQSFRWFHDGSASPALLRVIGPPYYSFLRAVDPDGQTAAPRAFTERGPRVWVQAGYTHPLLEQLRPPDGSLLLLRPPRDWLVLSDAPFRDIYEVLEFALPAPPARWQAAELAQQLAVPLRLATGGSTEPAELWVLREHALEQLDELVHNADDAMLARLAFAVGQSGDRATIVLRVRPSKLPPPVLVLEAQGFRPYLKLPNLFLPCGTRLHPPLRRDAVRRLLADNPDEITWLQPHQDGSFTPESLSDNVFRPLEDWVDYVLDHDRAALQAWVQAAQFDFDPFMCRDELEQPAKAKKTPTREKHKDPRPDKTAGSDAPPPGLKSEPRAKPQASPEADPLDALVRREPSQLKRQLHEVEKRFLEWDGPLDAPERQALWPELAALNAALGHATDATACWVNALWNEGAPVALWARRWASAERPDVRDGLAPEELDRVLANRGASPTEVRWLAAQVVWGAHHEPSAAPLARRLGRIQQFLQSHEDLLPVRGIWLAWLGVCRLAHGDVLALARARDRLLERLLKHGLSPELDLPSFLRFSSGHGNDRIEVFRCWLSALPERIRRWIHGHYPKGVSSLPTDTEAYADLILAFGLARLGEASQARQLREQARGLLEGRGEHEGDVHVFLREAFGYRIQQALDGKGAAGPLPSEQTEYLEQMERVQRYKADRLRQHSRILEPHEKINPYRLWHSRFHDDLGKALARLPDIFAPAQLVAEIEQLLRQASTGEQTGARRARVLLTALEVAPRVGEAFSRQLLTEVSAACDGLSEVLEQAALLEKALFLAAHFDQARYVQELVGRFRTLLQGQRGAGGIQALDSLAGQSFRGLRKLGMRDEIHALLGDLTEAVLQGETLDTLRNRSDWPGVLRTLLHVAAGWYYFGKDGQARPFIDEARALLFQGQLQGREQTLLACTYAATLGQAPAEFVLPAIEELFQKLEGVSDTYTTNSHYALSQLDVIESVVLAVVTEDFAMGATARRWLDDDEFLVRQRIHRDLHAAMGEG
jgi:hypothetical protein